MEKYIFTAEITEDENFKREWVSRIEHPRHMDEANGWEPGFYACDSDHEIGNAHAWQGPFETEAEAIEAVRADRREQEAQIKAEQEGEE